MARSDFLGEFEQIVLLALARLGEEAYGMAVQEEIFARTGRDVAIGSVYAALDRMERKGLVCSTLGDPTPERGGRAKRYFRLEYAGATAITRARESLDSLWEGLDLDPETLA